MADEELLQEGWQVHDLRSGVAKVYAEAKRRSTLGIRIAAAWGVVILVFGLLDFTQAIAVASPFWDLSAGFGGIILAALSVSRAPGPLLAAAVLVLGDLVMIAYGLPEMIDHGSATDHVMAGVRIALAPVTMMMIVNGWFGSVSIQAFKNGFSPGQDWRTRISPRTMQLIVIGSCTAALMLGVGTWVGAIMTGFAETDVTWLTKSLFHKPLQIKVAKPDIKTAGTDGKSPDVFAQFTVLDPRNAPPFKYPESAVPIESVRDMDDFMKHQVEEAFEFAADTNDQGCLLEGQGRQDRCRDDRCRYWARVFSRGCLFKAKKTEHFCDGVPAVEAVEDGLKWAERMCAGRKADICRDMLFTVQGHCHPPTPEIAKMFAPKPGAGTVDGDKIAAEKAAAGKKD